MSVRLRPKDPDQAHYRDVRIDEGLEVRTNTLVEQSREVDIVWSAGTDVVRHDPWTGERYIESLSMDPKHIRMHRFDGGMSLLDSHSAFTMEDRLGTIIPGSVRIAGGKGHARAKISRNAKGEALFQDLRDGHPFPVSVGYKTHAYEKTEAAKGALARLHAIDWEPFEISAVPIPADPAGHSREQPKDLPMSRATEVTEVPEDMTDLPTTRGAPPARRPVGGAEQERARIQSVQEIGRRSAIDEDLVAEHVRSGTGVDAFRQIAWDTMVARHEATGGVPGGPGPGQHRNVDIVSLSAAAIRHRVDPSVKLPEGAGRFAHMTLLDHARASIERSGGRVEGAGPGEIAKRAMHSTSDFPLIMATTAEQSLRGTYDISESSIKNVANGVTHADFRTRFKVDLGHMPKLLKINEHGEYKRGTLRESREGYGISTFGRIIAFTRQLIVNDDLGALTRAPAKFGQQARNFEIASLVELIEANPVMADGEAVFSEPHKNLMPAEALSIDALSKGRLLMRKQTSMSGELMTAAPRFLIVGPELETIAERLLTAVTPGTSGDVNPFAGKLELIVEPRLAAPYSWYLVASPASIDGIEFAHLEGEGGPRIETKEGWDVDGMEMKCRLDFGAGWLDWRGWVKNPGVAPA